MLYEVNVGPVENGIKSRENSIKPSGNRVGTEKNTIVRGQKYHKS